jgi:CheY-like chemotaxis protein
MNSDRETTSNYVHLIQHSGEQLLKIIDDVLDFAKIESNQLSIEIQEFEINKAINEIIEKHQISPQRLVKKQVKLTFNNPHPWQEFYLKTDRYRFYQIFDNLINNALKFTNEGIIEVGYSIFKSNNSGSVQLYVKDTGIGMDQNQLEIIFERFKRADSNKLPIGTGLGLSISKGLVSLLGGNIWVNSELNKGTAFYFTLPCENNDVKSLFLNKENGLIEIPDFSNYVIYTFETDLPSYLFQKEILLDTRVQLVRAENKQQLVDLIMNKLPDMVLLTISPETLNGSEVLGEIRKISDKLPVLVQTPFFTPVEKQNVLSAGASDYITKPIVQIELLGKMSRLLH